MSRSNLARANFKKYAEITNPLAASKSTSGSGTKTKSRESSQSVSGKANRGDDADEDPFGLGAIMASEKGLTREEDSGTGKGELRSRESAGKGGSRRNKHEEEEEEDPFGLGAIMASDRQHKSITSASEGSDGPRAEGIGKGGGNDDDDPGKSHNSGTKRGVPPDSITKNPSGGTSTGSALKAPRIGGYFSGSSPGMSGSTRGGGDDTSDFQTSGPPFIPSSSFKGARRGFVFQLGRLGLGYYVDKRAKESEAKSARLYSATTPPARTGTRSQDGDVLPGSKRSAPGASGKSGRNQDKVTVDVSEALQKLGPLLLKPKKVTRATSLMVDLMQAEMRPDNTRMFFRVLRPLAQEPGSEAALACGEAGARAFKFLLERAEWLGNPADAVRAVTWELVFSLRHEVRTDDSYQFARATKRLRQAIEALGDATAGGSGDGNTEDDGPVDGSGDGGDDGNGGVEMALSLERKRALVEIMKEIFKSYHLAWARSSIEPTFKAAADRRRLFPEGELRDAVDGFTDAITKRQRNPGGALAPPSRTIRSHNSVAHPTVNKRSDVVR